MYLTKEYKKFSLLLTLAVLLTVTSAQLYDFGPVASDTSLNPADELFVQVNFSIYLEGAAREDLLVSILFFMHNGFNEDKILYLKPVMVFL